MKHDYPVMSRATQRHSFVGNVPPLYPLIENLEQDGTGCIWLKCPLAFYNDTRPSFSKADQR